MKLMKSKKGIVFTSLLLGIAGLLFGIPIFYTWLKLMFFTPKTGFSPVWIIVIGFIVILLLKKMR